VLVGRCFIKRLIKWERNLLKLRDQLLTRKPEEEELRPSPSTSTRSSSRCTLTLVSPRRPWTSWTPSFMTLSTESPLKDPSSSDSTREELFHLGKSKVQLSSSSPENSQDTPCLREPRPSPNTFKCDFYIPPASYHSFFYKFQTFLLR